MREPIPIAPKCFFPIFDALQRLDERAARFLHGLRAGGGAVGGDNRSDAIDLLHHPFVEVVAVLRLIVPDLAGVFGQREVARGVCNLISHLSILIGEGVQFWQGQQSVKPAP